MSSRWFTRLLVATVAAVLLWAPAALADPAARVARISFVSGSVSFRPAALDQWTIASLNYPLTVGDQVWTDRAARSELQLGSTIVRIVPLTEFSVLNLDDHTAQLRVTQGALIVRVRALGDDDEIEIDTPNGAVSVLRPGLYRVDVTEAGDASTVSVREGEVDVAAGTTAFPLRRDQSVVLDGVDTPQSTLRGAARADDFEDWSSTRDRRADAVRSARYVSPEMIGFEDLDANGTWQVVADYGPVWMPRVRAEWVPYRYGHWAWVEPWGWTWIDDAPWGFAPFHYGRWAFLPARGWAWVPGTRVARPVYAPALVAFVGGSSWSASVRLGSGPVGWFPLGPREVYVPAYHVSPEYVQRVNVAHVTNINVTNVNVTNITYVNRAVPGAVTAVSRETFVLARPVGAAAVAVPRDQAQTAAVVGVAAVVPQRASIAGPAQTSATPPAAAVARQVVVRRAPPAAAVSFDAKQAALAQHPGQPVDAPRENGTRSQTSAAAPAPHPLVRAIAAPLSTPRSPSIRVGSPAAAPGVTAPAPVAAPPAPQPASPVAPRQNSAVAVPPAAGSSAPRQNPPTAAAPAANPAAGRPAAPQAVPDLAARHAQERAEIEARHAQERAALQAKHVQEQQAVQAAQRTELQQRHQQEIKALQARQNQERDAVQKRQQAERKQKGSDPKIK